MSILRFDFQRKCVRTTTGPVLNVGCNIDPANLKAVFGERIINIDFVEYDEVLEHKMEADVLFDATKPWPIENDSAELCIIGDTMEHVDEEGALVMLMEAHRCAEKLCITVPDDPRLGPGWHSDGSRDPEEKWFTGPGSYHVQQVTEQKLREWLAETDWEINEWHTVSYGFAQNGYFVLAGRRS